MARKQAKRRKPQKQRRISMPTIRWGRAVTPLLAVALVVGVYELALLALDREIRSIEISGPFDRVSAMQIEAALSEDLDAGFLRADLSRMRATIRQLEWIDDARVARRWPDRIAISVTEQVAAAVWDDRGLLNVRGELFVDDARHIPAELPRLSGPDARATDVAERYINIRGQLIPLGLDVTRVELSDRGAWTMMLANGIEVRLGRRNVDARTDIFLDVVANLITANAKRIDYVDLRYSNGFSIGWKDGSVPDALPSDGDDDPAMLALRGGG